MDVFKTLTSEFLTYLNHVDYTVQSVISTINEDENPKKSARPSVIKK